MVNSSGELRTGDTWPNDDAAVDPSKDGSEAEADEVEELDVTKICVIVDSEGSME